MGCCAANEDLPANSLPVDPNDKKTPRPQIAVVKPEPEPVQAPLEDLDAPIYWGFRDAIQTFEDSLPFNRIHVDTVMRLIGKAEADGVVSLNSLREHFNTPAWYELKDSSSRLSKILLSSAFKDPEKGTEAHQIDANTLRCFALLHSQGDRSEKAVALYNIVQEGGLEAHDQIAAADKDFHPNFVRIARLSSKDIFKLAHEFS